MKNYYRTPNHISRNAALSTHARTVLGCLSSCNPCFPSYSKLQEWTGFARATISKALKQLEETNIIRRYKKPGDRKVYYVIHWSESEVDKKIERTGREIRFTKKSEKMSSRREPIKQETSVHGVNRDSSPDEPISVHGVNSIKTKEKDQLIKKEEFEFFTVKESKDFVTSVLSGLKSIPLSSSSINPYQRHLKEGSISSSLFRKASSVSYQPLSEVEVRAIQRAQLEALRHAEEIRRSQR
jgi:DNA-binding transcriptional regulator YhcF (GntR family)